MDMSNGQLIRQLHLIETRPVALDPTAWPTCPLCNQSVLDHDCDDEATFQALKGKNNGR